MWQRRIDVGLLPASVAMKWPLTHGRARAKIIDDDIAGIKTHFETRSAGADFDARAYPSMDAKTCTAVLVGANAFIFVFIN
jgi:hypothetical protein